MKACLRPNQTSEQTGLTKYTNEDDGDYHLEAALLLEDCYNLGEGAADI